MESQSCPIPADEPGRLAAVRDYAILDTPPELEFDALTRLATFMFDAPIAVVAMMDESRLWFKSKIGLDVPELDRKVAFCAHAIMCPRDALVVPDLQADQRFRENPLVAQAPHIRFYAGAPIVDPGGFALGTIAIIDARPRQFDDGQRAALMDLSTLVMTALRNRRNALELGRLARTDHLTGIANRAQFELAVASQIQQAARSNESFAVLCMDLDGFKEVNDEHGHAAGDAVLREVARRVLAQVREGDTVARVGGDEFAVVMRGRADDDALALSKRIVVAVARPIALPSGRIVSVGMSIGEAWYSSTASTPEALMEIADQALYAAKRRTPARGARVSRFAPGRSGRRRR
jgi:diguanylate cyclase (GGDEF)-like protein